MFFSTLSFYDNFAENVVIFVVMSLAFFQPKYLKCAKPSDMSKGTRMCKLISVYQIIIKTEEKPTYLYFLLVKIKAI